jgi:CubicO group peptidase (beta-lactamase class C family)/D-alanyl-D-alanine dipeptidase
MEREMPRKHAALVLGLSLSLCTAGLWAQTQVRTPPPAADPAAQVDHLFARWDRTVSPGSAVAVMKDGRIVYARGYGMADLDHDVIITPATVFHVASVSKQFTAAAVLLLEQDGKLSLDEDIRTYVPELPDFGARITLRHLLHHTSGLRDQWDLLGLAGWRYSLDLITDADVLAVMARQKDLNFRPGERYLYCNSGFTLLAQVVKRVGGKSLREFTTERIFAPLGMASTHFRDDHAEIVKGMAYGYVPAGPTFRLSVTNFDTVGATSLLTTVEDLARWDENFYDPTVGGRALISKMLERGTLNDGTVLDYAAGLVIGTYKGLNTVDHGGSDAGYRSDLLRFPDQHFSVAVLSNTPNDPGALARQIADIYLAKELKPEPPRPEPQGLKLPAERLARLAGIYHARVDDGLCWILLQNGVLRMRTLPGDPGTELRALAEDRFKPAGRALELRFEPAPKGGMRLTATPGGTAKPTVYERAEEFKPTAAQLGEYAGEYRSAEIEPVYRIAVRGGDLFLERLKWNPGRLTPAIRDLFTSPLGTFRFVRDKRDKVSGILLNRGRILGFKFDKTADARIDRNRPPLEMGDFRHPDLVELTALDPSIRLDIRYARKDNFTGRPVYPEARAFLQRPAAEALVRVQRALEDKGYGLVVFDGYRPWAVTKLFWDITPEDKKNFVADPAEGSKHNRGCAVDLSLIDLKTGGEVEMPSAFDEMSKRAAADFAGGTPEQRARRDLLRRAMEKEGFEVYPDEWWHFDYKDWRLYRILNIPFAQVGRK